MTRPTSSQCAAGHVAALPTRVPARVASAGAPASPVRVRPARTPRDLARAVALRHTAYARRVGDWARVLERPEAADTSPDTRVLIAESTLDATVVGTVRLHVNRSAPLPIERAVTLPPGMRGAVLVEAVRMAVSPEHDRDLTRAARDALFRACWHYAVEHDAQWIVAAARKPIDHLYEDLLFEDVFEPGRTYSLPYVPDVPHRVMALCVEQAAAKWIARAHPLLDFMQRAQPGESDIGGEPGASVPGDDITMAAHHE